MGYDGTKLVYFNGESQWLMPDGSFVPAEHGGDGFYSAGFLYLKKKTQKEKRLIVDERMS